jgi:putative transposase
MEKTLNALLEPEADRLCNALRYEFSEVRRDTCIGNYDLKLQIKAGEVGLFEPRSVDHLFSSALLQ